MTPSAIYPIIKTWFRKAIWALMISTLILPAVILSGCGGDVSGGEQTVLSSGGPASGGRLFVNNVDGDDDNDGIDKPFKSLQYALDQLRPGDVLVVQNSGQPYKSNSLISETYDANGHLLKTISGFRLRTSGTASKPITIEGDPTLPPIIDQEQDEFASGSNTALGLLLDCVSHVVVRNIEVTRVNEAGISSSIRGDCETNNITLEGNRIHHVYGEKYVGGIRLMGVNDVIIQNNSISNIFSQEASEDHEFSKEGRGLSNIIIDGNTFTSLHSGIVINAQGLGNSNYSLNADESVTNLQIQNNNFMQVKLPVNFHNRINDDSANDEIKTGLFSSVDVSGNLFYDVEESSILIKLGDSEYQSESFCIFNNNFIDTALTAIDISGVQGVEIYNNIFVKPGSHILATRSPEEPITNSINFIDYNFFWEVVNLTWLLDAGGDSETLFSGLSSWQADKSHPQVTTEPDIASLNANPVFVDPLNNDFRLSDASPAILAGREGVSVGYDYSRQSDFKSNCRAIF